MVGEVVLRWSGEGEKVKQKTGKIGDRKERDGKIGMVQVSTINDQDKQLFTFGSGGDHLKVVT